MGLQAGSGEYVTTDSNVRHNKVHPSPSPEGSESEGRESTSRPSSGVTDLTVSRVQLYSLNSDPGQVPEIGKHE